MLTWLLFCCWCFFNIHIYNYRKFHYRSKNSIVIRPLIDQVGCDGGCFWKIDKGKKERVGREREKKKRRAWWIKRGRENVPQCNGSLLNRLMHLSLFLVHKVQITFIITITNVFKFFVCLFHIVNYGVCEFVNHITFSLPLSKWWPFLLRLQIEGLLQAHSCCLRHSNVSVYVFHYFQLFFPFSLSLSLSLLFLAFNNSNINYRSATALFGLIWVHVQDIQWAYNTYVQICAHVGTHTPEFQTCVPLVPFDLYNISSLNCIIHTIQPVSLLSFFLYLLWSLLLLIKNGNKL